jgi:hypothetical protein
MLLDKHSVKFKLCKWDHLDGQDTDEEEQTPKPKTDSTYSDSITAHPPNTNTLKVWFTSAHANIGGGAASNTTRNKLSRVSL